MAAEKMLLQRNDRTGLLEALWREQLRRLRVSEPGTDPLPQFLVGGSKGLVNLADWWPAPRHEVKTDEVPTFHIRIIGDPRCLTCSPCPSAIGYVCDPPTAAEPTDSWELYPGSSERLCRAEAVRSVNAKLAEFESRCIVEEEEWDEESVVSRSYEDLMRPGL